MEQTTQLITDAESVITEYLKEKPTHKPVAIFTVKDICPGGRRNITPVTIQNRKRLARWLLNKMKPQASVKIDGWVLSVVFRAQPFKYRAERT